ncbi:MAG TPA: 3-dehydroquinate synthase, partial [Dermacoccus sp.]|nr:3-dehydroquinate synthase [Dermacoccus sp.]
GKNLVGAFHEPLAVFADLATVRTLPERDVAAGLAEVVKCGFIRDERILELVEADPAACLDVTSPQLVELVERAISVKASVVAADLKESNLREILNYGHTFAHAIEQRENYTWRHGDAVAVGCVFAAELACAAGVLGRNDVERQRAVITSLGLPTTYAGGDFDEMLTVMGRDKKTRGTTLRFVVLNGIGDVHRLEGPTREQLRAAFDAVTG